MPTLLISLFLACSNGADTQDGTAAGSPSAAFDDTVGDLAATTERHGRDVSDAQGLSAIDALEGDYWSFCQSTWDTMSGCMSAFRDCDGMSGMMGPMNDWDGLTSDLWGWMQDHHDAMAACQDVACCHDEEDRWQQQMGDWLDQAGSTEQPWSDDCDW